MTVKTQINGTLTQVFFREGQTVKAGDILAQIDPRPYEAQLMQYEGQLLRDQALLANAQLDLRRYQRLWKQDSIAQQTLATQQSLVSQYEGAVQIDKGLIEVTKINLIYCKITSPINGRIGLNLVDVGNYVQTSDTGIAVINTLNPITVVFSIPEDSIPTVLPTIYAGKSYLVQAFDRQQNKLLAQGKLIAIDNQINSNTGTVNLKAQFDNNSNTLFPNQFVNIRLRSKILNKATVVPTAAIQYGANGTFTYILNVDDTVSVKPVEVGVTSGDFTTINTGLTAGQFVVVEGADNLTNGIKVAATNITPPKTVVRVASKRRSTS